MAEPQDTAAEQGDKPNIDWKEVADALVQYLDVRRDEHYEMRKGRAWLELFSGRGPIKDDYGVDDLRLLSAELAFRVIDAQRLARQGGAYGLEPEDVRRLADTLSKLADQLEQGSAAPKGQKPLLPNERESVREPDPYARFRHYRREHVFWCRGLIPDISSRTCGGP